MFQQPIFWKIHFVCWVVAVSWQFSTGYMLYFISAPFTQTVFSVINTIPLLIITLGLYGHAWRRRVLSNYIWKLMFYIMLVDILIGMAGFLSGRYYRIDFALGLPGALRYYPHYPALLYDVALVMVLSVIPVFGMFRYGWRSTRAWRYHDPATKRAHIIDVTLTILIAVALLRGFATLSHWLW